MDFMCFNDSHWASDNTYLSPLLGTCLVWVLVPSVGQEKGSQLFLYCQ
jgi:hypothetical protein